MYSRVLSLLTREPALDHAGKVIRGALFLGLELNYLLWGVQITQSYYYYKSYRATDSVWVKAAVGILFILDTLQSILSSIFAWRFMVQGLDVGPGQTIGWAADTIPFLDAVTASLVHLVYAQKIWSLLDPPYNYFWTVVVIMLSCLQLTAGFGSMVFMTSIDLHFSEIGRIRDWGSIWLVTAGVTDVIITAVIAGKLSTSRTGIKKTDDIISKLIRLIVETGLATAIVQIGNFILFIILTLAPYHTSIVLVIPKVYSNSMLALLNSRKPRNPNEMCSFCQDKPIDSMTIRAIQTVDVSRDYQLTEHRATNLGRPKTADDTKDATI